MASPFLFWFVGDLPVLFTYLVTNILHVTVFSSQLFLFFLNKHIETRVHDNSQKSLRLFFKTFNVLYHGLRSVIVRLHSPKFFFVWIFLLPIYFRFFLLVLFLFSSFLQSFFFRLVMRGVTTYVTLSKHIVRPQGFLSLTVSLGLFWQRAHCFPLHVYHHPLIPVKA